MKTYKVAVAGAGAVANLHAAAIESLEYAQLVAIVDIVAEKADDYARRHKCRPYYNLEEMLDAEHPDLVILAVPTFLHLEYVERCGAKGIHVLCEKPIEMDLAHAKQLVASAESNGIRLMVGQVVRFWQGYSDVKRMYENGELGDIMMAYFHRSSTVPARGGWIIDPKLGRGSIGDMHIHDVDFLEYMFGQAERVYTHAICDYTGCFDHAVSSFTFPGGLKAVAECSFATKNSYPFTTFMRICGTKATVEYSYRAGITDTKAVQNTGMTIFRDNETPVTVELEAYDPYARQLAYFISCIEAGTEPEVVSHTDSLRSIAMLDAARKSAETEEVVSVERV